MKARNLKSLDLQKIKYHTISHKKIFNYRKILSIFFKKIHSNLVVRAQGNEFKHDEV